MIEYITPVPPSVLFEANFLPLPREGVSPSPVLPSYRIWPGSDDVRHDFHDFVDAPVQLTPTLTTFYGHELIAPYGVTCTPVSQSRKVRVVSLTLHRADRNTLMEMTVAAWQGDNDTLHLLAPLPDEDELLGPVKRTVFGIKPSGEERRDWMLGKLYYGDTAILDVDISQIITPGKALRA